MVKNTYSRIVSNRYVAYLEETYKESITNYDENFVKNPKNVLKYMAEGYKKSNKFSEFKVENAVKAYHKTI